MFGSHMVWQCCNDADNECHGPPSHKLLSSNKTVLGTFCIEAVNKLATQDIFAVYFFSQTAYVEISLLVNDTRRIEQSCYLGVAIDCYVRPSQEDPLLGSILLQL